MSLSRNSNPGLTGPTTQAPPRSASLPPSYSFLVLSPLHCPFFPLQLVVEIQACPQEKLTQIIIIVCEKDGCGFVKVIRGTGEGGVSSGRVGPSEKNLREDVPLA